MEKNKKMMSVQIFSDFDGGKYIILALLTVHNSFGKLFLSDSDSGHYIPEHQTNNSDHYEKYNS